MRLSKCMHSNATRLSVMAWPPGQIFCPYMRKLADQCSLDMRKWCSVLMALMYLSGSFWALGRSAS